MIFNVRVSVIELVEADSEEQAIQKLITQVERKGLKVMDDNSAVICPSCDEIALEHKYHDAFESEDLDPKSLAAVLGAKA